MKEEDSSVWGTSFSLSCAPARVCPGEALDPLAPRLGRRAWRARVHADPVVEGRRQDADGASTTSGN